MQILELSGIGINLMWIRFITILLHGSVDSEGGTVYIGYTITRCSGEEYGEDLAVYDYATIFRHNNEIQHVRHRVNWLGSRSIGWKMYFTISDLKFIEGDIIVYLSVFTGPKQRVNDNPEYMKFIYGADRRFIFDSAKSGTGLDFGNFYNRNPISIESVYVIFTDVNKTFSFDSKGCHDSATWIANEGLYAFDLKKHEMYPVYYDVLDDPYIYY
ncbi:hypothetical protein DICVIV_03370 [Dictyocaulus viviparus]|uniref:DOMON domain protein n=1 Tax=Dictyocaulus viviparus TaxID=29172 RepID=A0A0D8Y176_DICVI|nr:hypothetical protein DICVIV_03370 [Dictyocaulus viviparus]